MMITELLKMIEEVDPCDTEKLDEIDARVWCLRNRYKFLEIKNHQRTEGYYNGAVLPTLFYQGAWHRAGASSDEVMRVIPKYTRSRDALKAIRPDGWFFTMRRDAHLCRCELIKGGSVQQSYWFDVEELAELHAILQAIAYERGK